MKTKKLILIFIIIGLTDIKATQNDIIHYLNKSDYWINKNLDSSTRYSEIAYRISLQLKDSALIATSAVSLSRNYEYIGQYQKALYYAKIALNIAERLNNDTILYNAYNSCGIQNEYLGNYEKANVYYDKSLLIAFKLKDISKISVVFNNKGLLNYSIGNFQKAYDYFNKHLMISALNKNINNVSIAYNNLAMLFQALGDKRTALDYYFKTLTIDENLKNDRYYSATLNNIASVYIDLKMNDSAYYYIKKCLKIKLQLNDLYGEMLCYQNLGNIYDHLEKNDSAETYFFKALKLNEKIKDHISNIEINNSLGNFYIKTKKLQNAIKYLKIAEETLQLNNYHKSNEVYYKLSVAYENINDKENAYKYLKLYLTAQDSLYKNESVKKIQERELMAEINRKKYLNELEILHKEQLLKERQEKNFFVNIIILCIGFATLLFGLLMYRNYTIKKKANNILNERNELITQQNQEITLQKKIIEEKNKDITDSIIYAKRLQEAMLPDETKFKQVFGDNFFILFLPKDIVSGDFYWLAEKEDGVLFAVSDCTGHGVPGGFMSIIANNALNRSIREFGLTMPNEILDTVNLLIDEAFSNNANNNEVRDGMDIALCLLKKEAENWSLYYSAANRPLWIVRNNTLIEMKGDNQPIGKHEKRKAFSLHKFNLYKNDILYLTSDGYADQFGGEEMKKFKSANFKRLLTGICHENMTEQKNILLQTHYLWKKNIEQLDDICVIGIKI